MRRLLVVLTLLVGTLLLGGTAWAAPGSCQIPPEPDRPGSGLVGMLDPTPEGTGRDDSVPAAAGGDPSSVYGEVGYAGTTWRTYDVCSRPDATAASTDTWLGSMLFDGAKTIVAAANGLHYQLGGSDQLDGLDALLHQGVRAMYSTVFTTWVGPALLVLAIGLLVLAARGDLARQAQRVGVAVAALAVAGVAYATPLSLLKASDSVLVDGVSQMQQGFLGGLGVGDPDALPETLVDQIVYANWLRGEFGSVDAPQARDLGRPLLRAQTFTRAEVAAGGDTADAANRKKQEFTALTAKMGDRYPQFQGIAGSRVGTGGVALLQSVALAAFPAAAKLVVFVAMIVLRLLVLFAPLIAVVAIMRPQILTGLFRLVAGVLVNAVLAGTLAAAHAWLVVTLLRPDSGVAPLLTLIVAATASIVFWVLIRPVRRLLTLGAMVLPHPNGPREVVAAGPAAALPATTPPVRAPLSTMPVRASVARALHLPRTAAIEPPALEQAYTSRSPGEQPVPEPEHAATVGAAVPDPGGAARPGLRGGCAGWDLGARDDRG